MRILIPTVTAGAGHLQAAAALEEAWLSLRPADEVRTVDVLDFTPKLYKKIYIEGYLNVVKHAPELYALVFKKTDNPVRVKQLTAFRRTFAQLTTKKFVKSCVAFVPDVVICTHYLPLVILGGLKPKLQIKLHPLKVCVVTDFEAHAFWMEPSVNLYCVAAEETKGRLVARGASPDNVVVTGIPIASKFSVKPDQPAIRAHYQLQPRIITLLVLGGGFGLGPVAEILTELDKVEIPLQVLVVCGRNESLRRKLSDKPRKHLTRVLGFISNMEELMAVSDLILTKPGGLTASEAMAEGKPLLILNPIPGQEAANSDFLLERGAAVKLNHIEDLPYKLHHLLSTKKLGKMSRAARAIGKPRAALDVCEQVLLCLNQRLPRLSAQSTLADLAADAA